MENKKVHLFISYAAADHAYYEELRQHLKPLEEEGLCSVFSFDQIKQGEPWPAKIAEALHQADIILFLVSADFIDSKYIQQTEIRIALDRHKYGETLILPVIIRPADWQSLPINRYSTLPKDSLPISSRTDRDTAWREYVVQPLRELMVKLRSGKITLDKSYIHEKKSKTVLPSSEADGLKAETIALIEAGESEKAFELLLEYVKKTNEGPLNDVLLLWSRQKHLTNQWQKGIIPFDVYHRSSAQINFTLLELIQAIPGTNLAAN
ncbi:MAG: toll/interleukin-1 receptor domain-containing protein [Saprospirales bacterium]|nr:toll/interleukin-1 receptor domain-containing protein [Saprospirales bacterium]MBK8923608.1 toll/interleukin-1 receptor domain-containing protein [Saprospirales bacterium]